jgi:hypothetical protein
MSLPQSCLAPDIWPSTVFLNAKQATVDRKLNLKWTIECYTPHIEMHIE